MFTFENFPLIIIFIMIVAAWLSFLSVVPWNNLF